MSFRDHPDLLSPRLGGAAVWANDEFFAPKENLLRETPAVFEPDRYTDRGKWMDGWETRRRREPGHDRCILRLGAPARLTGFVVDTAHFKGNHPEACSIDACYFTGSGDPDESADWIEIVERTPLAGDTENEIGIANAHAYTHLRLHIYPDGGVARFRAHGVPVARWPEGEADLADVRRGARVVSCSDAFFSPRHNLILPGDSRGMWDGWETKRRSPGEDDWVVVQLGVRGTIDRVIVDTSHFKGNAPAQVALEYADVGSGDVESASWRALIGRADIRPHHIHELAPEEETTATHVKLHIYPDGGVARLRLFGRAEPSAREAAGLAWLHALPEGAATAELQTCCGSTAWSRAMAAARPFDNGAELRERAREIWDGLQESDWLEAFAAHPRIGERSTKRFSAKEQSGTKQATQTELDELVRLNQAYEERNEFVFLICATGKSTQQMLEALRERLTRSREQEIQTARAEQAAITELRLEKLLS